MPSSVRARLSLVAVFGLVAVAVAGRALASIIQLGSAYPWKAVVVFAAMMTLAIGAIGRHPYARLGPANRVTIARAALLALMAGLIGEPATTAGAWAGVIGASTVAVLDGVDGWLARRSAMSSEFGARFDTETDALMILVMSVLVWQYGKAGGWVLAGGALRYAFVAAMWVLPWMNRPLQPTRRGKTVAVAHMVGLAVALGPIIPFPLSAAAVGVTLAALTWSFAVDVRRLWRNHT